MEDFRTPSSDLLLRESVTTMLWQAGEVEGDEDWDEHRGLAELSYAGQMAILRDLYSFIGLALEDGSLLTYLEEYDWRHLCHDYWLTRNGHGAGFWDRGLGDAGQRLTDLSEDGSYELFSIGDNFGWCWE